MVAERNMKNIEKLALLIIVLWVISLPLSSYVGLYLIPEHVSQAELPHLKHLTYIFSWVSIVIGKMVDIGIAIWLFSTARKDNASAWLWALLGLTSGVLAAVLYYLVRILRAIPGEAKTNC
jgi:uncharacterized BrkB/YihY/UPF0761 family membrane protein